MLTGMEGKESDLEHMHKPTIDLLVISLSSNRKKLLYGCWRNHVEKAGLGSCDLPAAL